MKLCADLFIKHLESQNLTFDFKEFEGGDVGVDFPYNGKTTKCIFTGDRGEYMSMYQVFEPVPEDNVDPVIFVCNKLHSQYKWVTFFVDDDNDIVLHHDALLCEENAAEAAFELLVRLVKIGDDAKPVLMKAIYG